MKCRYCKDKNPSSKEHLVANRRLIQINSFKQLEEINDNVPKTFKKITCESCNNELGKYEDKSAFNLAHATIWKILAGNINNAFERYPEYILKISSLKTININEEQLLNIIKENLILPELTFTFSFDAQKSIFQNRFGEAVKKIVSKVLDENGNPIEDAVFYSKDSFLNNNDSGYISKSNKNGEINIDILTRIEKIKIIKENIHINNEIKEIEIIIYISFDANNHRLILIFPLIGEIKIGLKNKFIEIIFEDLLIILQKHLPEISITELKNYYHKL
jgi:hypothetical protein